MRKTTVPTRPAPAPPPVGAGSSNSHRYTPTTNWDDDPFDLNASQATTSRKVPPPRPPPPRVQPSPVDQSMKGKGFGIPFKKPPQSVNILSNLFGSRGGGSSSPKLPPPPPTLKKHHQVNGGASRVTTVPLQSSVSSTANATGCATAELIDWGSPPSSPTLTHKTFNSDCISVDSFGSETHSNSSPQNGSYYSQAESGFEDDFSSAPASQMGFQKSVSNQITLLDPFSAPPMRNDEGPKIRQVPPPIIAQKPKIVDQSAFYTQNSISFQPAKPFDDPLSNGKSLIAPPAQNTVSMPTIIKPAIMAKPLGVPKVKIMNPLKREPSAGEPEEKTPSPPMPIYAPPPPPPEYFAMADGALAEDDEEEQQEPYGIALYDYESEHEGDLNFRENEKIYLVRQENADWMFGRSKRGCEGLFPVNYIEIKVPLSFTTSKQERGPSIVAPKAAATVVPSVREEKVEQPPEERRCRALYDFNAEALEDLPLTEGEIITVTGQVNDEWLLGRKKNGTQGQFPAAFVEYL